MTAQRSKKLTVEEYVELEQSTNTKYEYHDGEVFAMSGGSFNHSILCAQINFQVRNQLSKSDKNCFVFNSEMKLHIEKYNKYFYPDAMVVCGDFKQPDDFKDAITNPVLIVEVLSKKTEAYDRGEKFEKYQSIHSFEEYVLITQDKPKVEVFYRKQNTQNSQNTNNWQLDYYEGLETTFYLQSLKINVEMKALYDKIKFEN